MSYDEDPNGSFKMPWDYWEQEEGSCEQLESHEERSGKRMEEKFSSNQEGYDWISPCTFDLEPNAIGGKCYHMWQP